MGDICRELRRYNYQGDGDEVAELVGTMHEAADEIERLTAEVSELKQTIATIMWLDEQANDDRYSDEFIGQRYRAVVSTELVRQVLAEVIVSSRQKP